MMWPCLPSLAGLTAATVNKVPDFSHISGSLVIKGKNNCHLNSALIVGLRENSGRKSLRFNKERFSRIKADALNLDEHSDSTFSALGQYSATLEKK